MELFPLLKSNSCYLGSIGCEEEEAETLQYQLLSIFDRNIPGLEKYVELYTRYSSLLTMQAREDIEKFLEERREFTELESVSCISVLYNVLKCFLQ
jgi:hypothetical protein